MSLLLGMFLVGAWSAPSLAERESAAAVKSGKLALVVGNADYTGLPRLTNPLNDARDMAKTLKEVGFDVILETDVSASSLRDAIRRFGTRLTKKGVGLFYYSGHGVQVDGVNYLMPVNAAPRYAEDVPQQAVDANEVLRTMGAGALDFSLVVLDACRNSELRRQDNSVVQGLARMDAPEGSLIAYATGPNQLASDGFGKNSIYTGALLKEIATPGLRIEDLFKRVRSTVSRASGGEQVPVEFTSLLGDFYFRPPKPGARPPDAPALVVHKPGEEFQDCEVCPLMVVVPKGSFTMGNAKGNRHERPAHEVTFANNFAIGKFEVTFEEWNACSADGACPAIPPDANWGGGKRPVVNVSWDDARAYTRWLSRKTGQTYGLPSEAQWEYAARANTKTNYWWGDAPGPEMANCRNCGSQWDGQEPAPVGSFKPNPFGLHDVHGNVWEWVEDCWHGSYRGAPSDGSARTGGACTMSVLRGGSWRDQDDAAKVTTRARYAIGSRSDFGFRVVRNVPQ